MTTTLKIDISKVFDYVPERLVLGRRNEALKALKALYDKTGKGNDFLGWVHLPSSITDNHLRELKTTAHMLQNEAEILVVTGIGGSYLGTLAVDEALSHSFQPWLKKNDFPRLLYAGQNISEDYMAELLEILEDKSYAIAVISKSGTTTEPAIAFRILREHLEKKVGKDAAAHRIVAITDAHRGALKQLADSQGYKTFVIPDDVGGRYSVLTPVGLLPLAVAGHDIDALVNGARAMEMATSPETDFENNPSALYAATRNTLYRNGKNIEILASFHHKLVWFAEWWKQLYGESEGKDNTGIFPASVNYTTDLHSMGQYVQEGMRSIFESVITVENPAKTLRIPHDEVNLDELNYISNKRIDEVNKMAELGTLLAHVDGGVPNIRISIPALTESSVGELIYFFEIACGISGYLQGINPFDQPGVEAYKKNMFALLGKPGFEELSRKLRNRL
ncbi:MAG: glucose-6-phosphate isomerase [Bacteroidales bacterium]|nr:glucose-6-phosphate isomerase [Bacteroidales bacterium]